MTGPIEMSPEAQEWQRRHDAACAVVARKYCDMFEFWRDCRYKPCRAARRCSGDQGACLQSRYTNLSYDAQLAAHTRMIAETPPNPDNFSLMAHHYPPASRCLHDPKNQKKRAATARAKNPVKATT